MLTLGRMVISTEYFSEIKVKSPKNVYYSKSHTSGFCSIVNGIKWKIVPNPAISDQLLSNNAETFNNNWLVISMKKQPKLHVYHVIKHHFYFNSARKMIFILYLFWWSFRFVPYFLHLSFLIKNLIVYECVNYWVI